MCSLEYEDHKLRRRVRRRVDEENNQTHGKEMAVCPKRILNALRAVSFPTIVPEQESNKEDPTKSKRNEEARFADVCDIVCDDTSFYLISVLRI